jgi:hypothetical protein
MPSAVPSAKAMTTAPPARSKVQGKPPPITLETLSGK